MSSPCPVQSASPEPISFGIRKGDAVSKIRGPAASTTDCDSSGWIRMFANCSWGRAVLFEVVCTIGFDLTKEKENRMFSSCHQDDQRRDQHQASPSLLYPILGVSATVGSSSRLALIGPADHAWLLNNAAKSTSPVLPLVTPCPISPRGRRDARWGLRARRSSIAACNASGSSR